MQIETIVHSQSSPWKGSLAILDSYFDGIVLQRFSFLQCTTNIYLRGALVPDGAAEKLHAVAVSM
jgi:hypothetical protein